MPTTASDTLEPVPKGRRTATYGCKLATHGLRKTCFAIDNAFPFTCKRIDRLADPQS